MTDCFTAFAMTFHRSVIASLTKEKEAISHKRTENFLYSQHGNNHHYPVIARGMKWSEAISPENNRLLPIIRNDSTMKETPIQ